MVYNITKTRLLYTIPLLFFTQAVVAPNAQAQVMAPLPPQMSQLPLPPATLQGAPNIQLRTPARGASLGDSGASVRVDVLHVSGETRFPEATLIAAAGFSPGRTLTLADLRLMAQRIRDYYSAHGYIVAQAYLPAQDVNNGAITIEVVEGRYGAVRLEDRARLTPSVARGILSGLGPGDVVAAAPLERRLLLLSDLPGVEVNAVLSPGADVGTSDLTVGLRRGAFVSGDLEVDNYGNPYTGAYQGGGTVNFNEPLGIGDVASVRVLTSGDGMQYIRGAYQAQLGLATLGGSYAYFHYRLGGSFSGLDANGAEEIASVYATYPIVRSYDNNLRGLVDFDHRTLQDNIGSTGAVSDRAANVGIIGLIGDHHDRVWGGGWDAYSLYGSVGNLNIESPLARAIDAGTARTAGGYEKFSGSFDRLQTIAGPLSLYGEIRGQVASKNLDISEKMELGGPYGVRAYPEGEAYGDEGYIATVEARLWLPTPVQGFPGRLQLIGFFDTGYVQSYQNPWIAGPNSVTRSGAGAGLNWFAGSNFTVKVAYAQIVGTGPATSYPDRNGQFWFEVVKFF
jgi:hemolysin activation/secretion protein